jgi:hypothetical protein
MEEGGINKDLEGRQRLSRRAPPAAGKRELEESAVKDPE